MFTKTGIPQLLAYANTPLPPLRALNRRARNAPGSIPHLNDLLAATQKRLFYRARRFFEKND